MSKQFGHTTPQSFLQYFQEFYASDSAGNPIPYFDPAAHQFNDLLNRKFVKNGSNALDVIDTKTKEMKSNVAPEKAKTMAGEYDFYTEEVEKLLAHGIETDLGIPLKALYLASQSLFHHIQAKNNGIHSSDELEPFIDDLISKAANQTIKSLCLILIPHFFARSLLVRNCMTKTLKEDPYFELVREMFPSPEWGHKVSRLFKIDPKGHPPESIQAAPISKLVKDVHSLATKNSTPENDETTPENDEAKPGFQSFYDSTLAFINDSFINGNYIIVPLPGTGLVNTCSPVSIFCREGNARAPSENIINADLVLFQFNRFLAISFFSNKEIHKQCEKRMNWGLVRDLSIQWGKECPYDNHIICDGNLKDLSGNDSFWRFSRISTLLLLKLKQVKTGKLLFSDLANLKECNMEYSKYIHSRL